MDIKSLLEVFKMIAYVAIAASIALLAIIGVLICALGSWVL